MEYTWKRSWSWYYQGREIRGWRWGRLTKMTVDRPVSTWRIQPQFCFLSAMMIGEQRATDTELSQHGPTGAIHPLGSDAKGEHGNHRDGTRSAGGTKATDGYRPICFPFCPASTTRDPISCSFLFFHRLRSFTHFRPFFTYVCGWLGKRAPNQNKRARNLGRHYVDDVRHDGSDLIRSYIFRPLNDPHHGHWFRQPMQSSQRYSLKTTSFVTLTTRGKSMKSCIHSNFISRRFRG